MKDLEYKGEIVSTYSLRLAAVEILVNALNSRDTRLRALESIGNSVRDLNQLHISGRGKLTETLIEPLIEALGVGVWRGPLTWEFRRSAARALGEIGDARALEPLIELVGGQEWSEKSGVHRGVYATALGKIGDARAVEPLIKAILSSSSNSWAKNDLVWALKEIGDDTVSKALIEIYNERKLDEMMELLKEEMKEKDSHGEWIINIISLIEKSNNLAVTGFNETNRQRKLRAENEKTENKAAYGIYETDVERGDRESTERADNVGITGFEETNHEREKRERNEEKQREKNATDFGLRITDEEYKSVEAARDNREAVRSSFESGGIPPSIVDAYVDGKCTEDEMLAIWVAMGKAEEFGLKDHQVSACLIAIHADEQRRPITIDAGVSMEMMVEELWKFGNIHSELLEIATALPEDQLSKEDLEFLLDIGGTGRHPILLDSVLDSSKEEWTVESARDLLEKKGFNDHPEAVLEVLEGVHWKAAAIKRDLLQL